MTHLFIEALDDGSIPLYDWDVAEYYVWNHPVWDIRSGYVNKRVLISLDTDEPLTLFLDELPSRLDMLQPFTLESRGEPLESRPKGPSCLEMDGTIVLVIRSCWSCSDSELLNFSWVLPDGSRSPDRHKINLLGGLAFIPRVIQGHPLEGRNPARIIEQMCLRLAGKEYDSSVELVPEFLEEAVQKSKEREKRINRVLARAKATLRSHLTSSQREEFDSTGQFHVRGADGYVYLILDQIQHNVFRIEDGKRTAEYCIITESHVPTQDQMLAQKLLLEANPQMFHDITNTWLITEDGKRVFQKKAE